MTNRLAMTFFWILVSFRNSASGSSGAPLYGAPLPYPIPLMAVAFLSLVVESTLWPQNIENRELTRSRGGWYQDCRGCQCSRLFHCKSRLISCLFCLFKSPRQRVRLARAGRKGGGGEGLLLRLAESPHQRYCILSARDLLEVAPLPGNDRKSSYYAGETHDAVVEHDASPEGREASSRLATPAAGGKLELEEEYGFSTGLGRP